jgi:serine/threonine protein kinase
VAIKVVSLQKVRAKGLDALLMTEIKLLKELRHEHLIRCLDVLMTPNNCYIVTEHCNENDLASLLARKSIHPLR